MNDPTQRQASFNAASDDQWEGFTSHRQKVSALLSAGAPLRQTRLCVLGAGNCNDLDLTAILQSHSDVTLVDLDSEALARGAARQGLTASPSLRLAGGVDLTGMLETLGNLSPRKPIPRSALASLVEEPARRVAPKLSGPFDLVASTCLLSQLIGNAFHAVGDQHPQFMELVQAIRAGHLRLLNELCTRGGTVTLITDVVSSDTFPELWSFDESALSSVLPRLSRERNFINGVNPDVLLSTYQEDVFLGSQIADLELIAPWRWKLHARQYLVLAIRYRKHSALLTKW